MNCHHENLLDFDDIDYWIYNKICITKYFQVKLRKWPTLGYDVNDPYERMSSHIRRYMRWKISNHVPIIEKKMCGWDLWVSHLLGYGTQKMHVCNLKPQHIGTPRRKNADGSCEIPTLLYRNHFHLSPSYTVLEVRTIIKTTNLDQKFWRWMKFLCSFFSVTLLWSW